MILMRRIALALAIMVLPFTAVAQPVDSGHAVAELISERESAAPGDRFLGALKLDLDEGGWHVYWVNPGDSGLPPEIYWDDLPEGVELGEFSWPTPHPIRVETLMNYGYEHQVVLPFEIQVPETAQPGDTLTLTGEGSWLICLDICIPEGGDLRIDIPIAAQPVIDEASSEAISRSLAHSPMPVTGAATFSQTADAFQVWVEDADLAEAVSGATEIRLLPDEHNIQHAADQEIRLGPQGVSITAPSSDYAEADTQTFSGIVFVEAPEGEARAWRFDAQPGEAIAGVATAAFTGGGGSGMALAGGGAIGLVSIIGAAFLGGLILNLMPCVLPVLSIKAASLVSTAHDPRESRMHGLAYMGGVLICFVAIGIALFALRAAGESAGLGFQLQYPPVTALFALLMFVVGLNMLGMFEWGGSVQGVGSGLADRQGVSGAFFTGLLAGLVGAPCVGPFMGPAVGIALTQSAPVVMGVFLAIGLGLAAPLVLISFTPGLARLLPKPGKWMETFRQVLAFPMFLTALWLLWVLAGQAGSNAVLLVLAGAVLFAFGIWLAKQIGRDALGKAVTALVLLGGFLGPAVGANFLAPPAVAGSTTLAEADSEDWSPERISALRGEGRVIFVDFTARWCVTCQLNKAAIHSERVLQSFADNDVAFLIADWTNRDEVIAAALAEHDRAGVPLYLVYPADGGEPEVLPQILTPGLLAKAIEEAAGA